MQMDQRFKINISKLQENGDTFNDWFILDEDQPLEGNYQCICTKRLKYAYVVIHRTNGNQIFVGKSCLTKFKNSYKKANQICINLGKKYQKIEQHEITEYVQDCIMKFVKDFTIEKYEAIMCLLKIDCPIRELLQPYYETLKQKKLDEEIKKLEKKYKRCYCCTYRGICNFNLGIYPVCHYCYLNH